MRQRIASTLAAAALGFATALVVLPQSAPADPPVHARQATISTKALTLDELTRVRRWQRQEGDSVRAGGYVFRMHPEWDWAFNMLQEDKRQWQILYDYTH